VSDKVLTLPLTPRWRDMIKGSPYCVGDKRFTDHILDHKSTEEAIKRIVKVSQKGEKGVSYDYLSGIISVCNYVHTRTIRRDHPPWMSNRKEMKLMADATRRMRNRLSQILKAFTQENLRLVEGLKPDRHRVISIMLEGHTGMRFSDIDILESLDVVANYWEVLSKPRVMHRPKNWRIEFFLSRLDQGFRSDFSKPLIPVIALLAQAVSDTIQTLNGEAPSEKWTPARVTTRLKRIPKEKRAFHSHLKK